MYIPLKIVTSTQYFDYHELGEVDYDETGDSSLISMEEYELVCKIISCEAAIYALRRSTGVNQMASDTMYSIRREYVNQYKSKFNRVYESPNYEDL